MAKILIEIDDKTSKILNKAYHSYTDIHDTLAYPLYSAVMEGIVIPDNATNKDVIRALFPDIKVYECGGYAHSSDKSSVLLEHMSSDWWDAPYKAGDTDG